MFASLGKVCVVGGGGWVTYQLCGHTNSYFVELSWTVTINLPAPHSSHSNQAHCSVCSLLGAQHRCRTHHAVLPQSKLKTTSMEDDLKSLKN
jgi:hypothetical protein